MVGADRGKLDALSRRLMQTGSGAGASADIAEIGRRWRQVRSELVGHGANRNDLIASDSAVRSLRSTSGGTRVARAANALTAALAPIYPPVGIGSGSPVGLPAPVDEARRRSERMGRCKRRLDFGTFDMARRSRSRDESGRGQAGAAYTGALNAVQDAITARSEPRFIRAIARADRSLESVEKAIDTEEPPWRRFLHNVGF